MSRHLGVLEADRTRMQDPDKARKMLENLLKTDPTAPEGGAYDVLGQIHLQMGDLMGTQEIFEKHIEIYPNAEGTWLYLGLIAELMGDASKAQSCYSKAPGREFDPEYVNSIRMSYLEWQANNPKSENRKNGKKAWWAFWRR